MTLIFNGQYFHYTLISNGQYLKMWFAKDAKFDFTSVVDKYFIE